MSARRVLILDHGEMSYDFLILATGATHAYFGHDEWQVAAPGLKTLEDALEIRRRVLLAYERAERESDPAKRAALLTFVVIGGGPTGVETRRCARRDLASITGARLPAFRSEFGAHHPDRGRSVNPLRRFPRRCGKAAAHDLKRLGVEVRYWQGRHGVSPTGASTLAANRSRRRRCCGRRASRRRRSGRRSVCQPIAPAA